MTPLGVGAVYCPALHPLFESEPDLLPVAEIEPQMFWRYRPGRSPRYELNGDAFGRIGALPQHKLVHGVGFPVGGSCQADPQHRGAFRESVARLRAHWASEHLAFNVVAGPEGERQCGFFLPPCQTAQGVALAAANLRAAASAAGVPFAFETGVNYLRPQAFELPDGEYFARVAEAADCGILLDLHNLWANERNGREPLLEVLAALPLERVREVHVAGGTWEDGYWLDAHCGAVPGALLELTAEILPRLPNLSALVLEVLPEYVERMGLPAYAREIEKLQAVWSRGRLGAAVAGLRRPATAQVRAVPAAVTPQAWEQWLASAVSGPGDEPLPDGLRDDPGLPVFRKLVREARLGNIADTLRLTCTLLLLARGQAFLRGLVEDYARRNPPEFFAHAEASGFARHLHALALDVPYLADVLAFERTLADAALYGRGGTVQFGWDPSVVLGALADGVLPVSPPGGRFLLAVELA